MSDTGSSPVPPSTRRSRGRNVVAASPHVEDYERLLAAGWSSLSLEQYAAYRYGEAISSQTFRRYRAKRKIVPRPSPYESHSDELVDPVATRAALIRLQERRIAVDAGHELGTSSPINKLFNTTRFEIRLLSELLDAHKADLQDLGLFPKAGEKIVVSQAPAPAQTTGYQTLGEMFEIAEDDAVEVAKVLHLGSQKSDRDRAHKAASAPPIVAPTPHPTRNLDEAHEAPQGRLPPAPPPSPPALGAKGSSRRRGPSLGFGA